MVDWHFYEKNRELINDPVANPYFEEILAMSKEEFRDWCATLRKTVVRLWDEQGTPPRVGYDKAEIIDQFKQCITYPIHEMERVDLLTGNSDVIRNTSSLGNAVNQWFPTMMKTRITYGTTTDEARSIYDYFAQDELFDTFVTYASRHFRRDSFYHYSTPISEGDVIVGKYKVTTAKDFVLVNSQFLPSVAYNFWLCPVKEDKEYTGYNTELKKRKNVVLTRAEIEDLAGCLTPLQVANVDYKRSEHYTVRLYTYGERLFPIGLKAFRVSFCQYAHNFPPLVARYLYERYTEQRRKVYQQSGTPIVIYDPSAGWGGRLVGALSMDSRYRVHYIGTDPNSDHNLSDGRTKYHEVADFFQKYVRGNTVIKREPHTVEIFQHGSEDIHKDPAFQKWKGKVDLVFTSPPYFAKEVYSDDPEQSCHKFIGYDAWRVGFLHPTLRTAIEWLRPGGYLLWNIADAKFGKEILPLEKESFEFLVARGMVPITTHKMTLAQMPGGNRFEETGEDETITRMTVFGEKKETTKRVVGRMQNYVQIVNEKGKKIFLKYEPIYVFKKPLNH